jgi:titin
MRFCAGVLVLALALQLPAACPTEAASYIVDTVADELDGSCSDDCSLRDAITLANGNPGSTIGFNVISGCTSGVCTIQPTSGLPPLSGGTTTIDGYTQPGAAQATGTTSATLKIVINGASAGDSNGLFIDSANNVVRGVVVNGFAWDGIRIDGSGALSNTITGNYVGTDVSGTSVISNAGRGVIILGGAKHNVIGGDAPGERNVISGNGRDFPAHPGVYVGGNGVMSNTVSGNYIGTDATGTIDLGNGGHGVYVRSGATYNVVGGDEPGERNVISGNDLHGVRIETTGTMSNTVSGNYIGIDASGTVDLGNTLSGIDFFNGPTYNTVGGDEPGERNVISGNGQHGVYVETTGTMSNTVSGNHIGTDVSGTVDLGNSQNGVNLYNGSAYNTIGGDEPGERNVISGNDQEGVYIGGTAGNAVVGNIISGNHIGVDAGGTAEVGNAWYGVAIGVYAEHNTIGGDEAGERNVISGNGWNGIDLGGSTVMSNTVSGNYIGTDAAGTAKLGNSQDGVHIGSGARYNIVGGSAPGERNVISGNGGDGVDIADSNTVSNTVLGNAIGTDSSGAAALGNGVNGVIVGSGAKNNTIGPNNVIAYNDGDGVRVYFNTTLGSIITQNAIFSNDQGIDLMDGAHGGIGAPIILTTTLAPVQVVGTACAECTVEVFESDDADGEGESFVGDATATVGGVFTITAGSLSRCYLTATATDVVSGTSEFSPPFEAMTQVFLPLVLRSYS